MHHLEDRWENYDLTLKNGKRVLACLNPSLIIDPTETPYTRLRLTKRFPFIRLERKTCVKFTQKMERNPLSDEQTYIIDCNLLGFMSMFGIESTWSRTMMKSDIKYGEH